MNNIDLHETQIHYYCIVFRNLNNNLIKCEIVIY